MNFPRRSLLSLISRLSLLIVLAGVSARAEDATLHETFYVPFENSTDATVARGIGKTIFERVDGYEAGPAGQAVQSVKKYNGLKWDGRGNIDLSRGTMAFFYKPQWKIDVKEWFAFAGVSGAGYWGMLSNFIIENDKLAFQHFDDSRYTQQITDGSILENWKTGEWVHLAAVWDRNQGTKLYQNGKLVGSTWGQFRWDWNPEARVLLLGPWIYSSTPFGADDLHVYADCLTDEQIAQLAQGKAPTGAPLPPLPESESRPLDLARYGWTEEDQKEIPALDAGKALEFTFARFDHAVDSKRMLSQPFSGLRGNSAAWPNPVYGSLLSGRLLELYLSPGQEFDRLRVFAQNRNVGRFMQADPVAGLKTIKEVNTTRPVWRARLDGLYKNPVLFYQRDRGSIGQIDLFRVNPLAAAKAPKADLRYVSASPLAKVPLTEAGLAILGDTPVFQQNAVRATAQGGPAWESKSPAFGGFQLLTEELPPLTPAAGVVLKLSANGLDQPTPVHIVVKEPIWAQRTWLTADVILQPGGPGRSDYTVVLRGRPMIVPPEGTLVRGKTEFSQPRMELAVMVTAANPVRWAMGEGGTSVGLIPAKLEEIKPAVIADQEEFLREAFGGTIEGHIWDGHPIQQWADVAWPLRYLLLLAPESRLAMQAGNFIGFRKGSLPWNPPVNDTGAPDWAFWQIQAMNANRRIVEWIIDNRQLPDGEFGGVYGDDTDLCEEWGNYALSTDDSGKVHAALRRLWEGLWKNNLVEGVSRTIRDNLHSYEEGQGTISHALLIDYGNPTDVERVMVATSHLYPKWMKKNDDGTYSFKGWYLGQSGVWENGNFGQDNQVNDLMMVPGSFLLWYNKHPYPAEYIFNWKLNREGKITGIVADALYEFNKDNPEVAKAYQAAAEAEIKAKRFSLPITDYIDTLGLKESWKEPILSGALSSPLVQQLPPNTMSASAMTHAYWLAYRSSGDVKYLTESYKKACELINNLDLIYTICNPSTDRIPLPHVTVSAARMGAEAVHRGGNGNFWPRYGLTYTKGANDVAALVTENTDKNLTVRFWSFAPGEHQMQTRVWRLLPGQYEVTLSKDVDNNGTVGETISKKNMDLTRGSYLDLELPPRQGLILTVKALKTQPFNYDLPDPAIGPGDVSVEAFSGHCSVNVHNIGTKPAKNIKVRLRDKDSHAILGEATIPEIEAPLDLKARSVLLEFHNIDARSRGHLEVEIEGEGGDLNPFNNRVDYQF